MSLRLVRRLLLLLLLLSLRWLLRLLLLLLRLALARVGSMHPGRAARVAAWVAGPIFATLALAAIPMRLVLNCWVALWGHPAPAALAM